MRVAGGRSKAWRHPVAPFLTLTLEGEFLFWSCARAILSRLSQLFQNCLYVTH